VSTSQEDPEEQVDTENVGGLGEVLPDQFDPVWSRVESFQAFRRTHGDTYTKAMEAILGVALTAGYLYWLFLYLTG